MHPRPGPGSTVEMQVLYLWVSAGCRRGNACIIEITQGKHVDACVNYGRTCVVLARLLWVISIIHPAHGTHA
ncbi:hypothetical protein Y032_0049g1736 [Ancylostoma ceylanicum]|uniref:Uncharacterized protein n=1 Tax=Ancylostoma ceylanicum TaxID=53326 RepID=A0A016U8T4_9BILA|nr:hypothetical protein Y032_0049g1736 [Ancylostoma ceylanicum]